MRLIEIEQDNADVKMRLSQSEAKNAERDSENTKLRRRLQALEKENETVKNANAEYERERRGLEREVALSRHFDVRRCFWHVTRDCVAPYDLHRDRF